jgi:putative Mn2+ efflux pump MntP
MRVRPGRIIAAVVVAEILGVAILAALVTIFGPPGFKAAQPFAQRLGAWVGPISGFVLCTLGGWWVARHVPRSDRLVNGFATGLSAAILDVAIAAAFGSILSLLLLLSNAGRIVGGSIGGWLASRRA